MLLHEPTPGAAWMVEGCETPNSRSCDGFSERLQTVLFAMEDPVLNPVYNANADVWHVPRGLGVIAREWVSLNAKAEVARVHRDVMWCVHHLSEADEDTHAV